MSTENSKAEVILSNCAIFRPATAEFRSIPAVLLGMLFYGERLTPRTIAAIALVAVAVVLLGADAAKRAE